MRTPSESGFLHALGPIVFGLFAAACIPLLRMGAITPSALSPFAGTVIAFAAAALLMIPTGLPALLRDARPSGRLLLRSALAGTLLLFAVFLIVFGLSHGASVLGSVLFLALVPSLSLVGRKILWGESLAFRQQVGLLMSVLAASVWLMVGQKSTLVGSRPHIIPALYESAFAGHMFVFLGVCLLSLALAAGRPSELRVSLTTWWFHTVGFAFVVSLPFMYAAHLAFEGPEVAFAGAAASTLRRNPEILFPYVAFGLSQIFLRLRLLGKSSVMLSAGATSLLASGGLLLAGSLFAGLLGESASLLHFALLPLHLVGLCLSRDALVPWAPYAGPRDAGPVSSRERVA